MPKLQHLRRRRYLNPFFVFRNMYYRHLIELQAPDLHQKSRLAVVGEYWRAMEESEKNKYRLLARSLKKYPCSYVTSPNNEMQSQSEASQAMENPSSLDSVLQYSPVESTSNSCDMRGEIEANETADDSQGKETTKEAISSEGASGLESMESAASAERPRRAEELESSDFMDGSEECESPISIQATSRSEASVATINSQVTVGDVPYYIR